MRFVLLAGRAFVAFAPRCVVWLVRDTMSTPARRQVIATLPFLSCLFLSLLLVAMRPFPATKMLGVNMAPIPLRMQKNRFRAWSCLAYADSCITKTCFVLHRKLSNQDTGPSLAPAQPRGRGSATNSRTARRPSIQFFGQKGQERRNIDGRRRVEFSSLLDYWLACLRLSFIDRLCDCMLLLLLCV